MLQANPTARRASCPFTGVTPFRTKTRSAARTTRFLMRHVTKQAIVAIEDAEDLMAVREWENDPDKTTIPWEQVKAELGL